MFKKEVIPEPERTACRLVLIRHAEMDCRAGDTPLLCGSHDAPLSANGKRQVERLRARLAADPPAAALYASPLVRAVETARAAPPDLLGRMRLLDALAEIDCGIFEGIPIEQVRRLRPDLWQRNARQDDENFRWPRGESYRQFRKRVMRVVRAIARSHAGTRVLVVTHAGVINQVLNSISGASAARWEHPRPRNCSVTELSWSGPGAELERYDDCFHLGEEE